MGDDRRARLRAVADRALADNIDRYRRAGRQKGGPYTLAELLAEQHDRQKAGQFDTLATARLILAQAAASPDGVTTYGALWSAFRPDTPWRVFPGRREITNALERVQHHCLRHQLPLLATLVVNAGERELTDAAKANIANWAREHGLSVGSDVEAFIAEQQKAARAMAADRLT